MEDVIREKLVPTLTDKPPPNDVECHLFSLPARLGGLAVPNPCDTSDEMQQATQAMDKLKSDLPEVLKRSIDLASERGASSWLTTLPIADFGFKLHKGAFRDAIALR